MAAPIDLARSHCRNEMCNFMLKKSFCTQLCIKPTGLLLYFLFTDRYLIKLSLNPQLSSSQPGNHYTNELAVNERHGKAFND